MSTVPTLLHLIAAPRRNSGWGLFKSAPSSHTTHSSDTWDEIKALNRMALNQSVYSTDHSSSVLRTHSWRTVANSVNNVSFDVGDIHSLPFNDDTFDVVHAHQVLQHIADPIKALKEMRRVTKPGGLVACRESASMTWYPESSTLDKWYRVTAKMAAAKGGNPHPGSHIHVWAEQSGFAKGDISRSTGSWCFSSDEEREYWGGSIGQRARSSGFATMAVEEGFSTVEELEEVQQGWDKFREDGDAWFGLLHGEILCRK
jgi:ubiquinone/menaquinone biosynthesis C-methylase UbiE